MKKSKIEQQEIDKFRELIKLHFNSDVEKYTVYLRKVRQDCEIDDYDMIKACSHALKYAKIIKEENKNDN